MERGRCDEGTERGRGGTRDRDRERERGRMVLTPVIALMYDLV